MAETDPFEGDFCKTGRPPTPPTAEEMKLLDPRLIAYGRFVARQYMEAHAEAGIVVPADTATRWSLEQAVSIYRSLKDNPRPDAFDIFYRLGQRILDEEAAQ